MQKPERPKGNGQDVEPVNQVGGVVHEYIGVTIGTQAAGARCF